MMTYLQDPEAKGGQLGAYAFAQLYPNFQFVDDDITPLEALCKEVRKRRLSVECKSAIDRILDLAETDPIAAAAQGERILKGVYELGYSKKTDVRFAESIDRTLQRMELIEQGVDLSIASWPWTAIQDETMGIQKDDYIVYYGRPKSMKSWVLAKHIAHTYINGQKALIYTKEMHPDNIFMRVAACIAGIPYREFRQGKLTADEKKLIYDLRNMAHELSIGNDMICLSGRDAPGGKDTVDWLEAKIDRHKPDLVFIDGMYLMSDSVGSARQKDHDRVRNISRSLRQMIFNTGTPVICTLQANRQAAKNQNAELDEIAFSDAIGQDATVIIRVINEKTSPTIAMVIGGSREFELHGFRIYGVPATNFEFKEIMTEKEINKAKEKDQGDGEEEKAAAHAKERNGAANIQREARSRQEQLIMQQLKANGL